MKAVFAVETMASTCSPGAGICATLLPLENYDPWLAEEFRLIANGQHPRIRAIWIGRTVCGEVVWIGKLLILLKSNKWIAK